MHAAPVHPCWQQLKDLLAAAKADRDVLLHRFTEKKLADNEVAQANRRAV